MIPPPTPKSPETTPATTPSTAAASVAATGQWRASKLVGVDIYNEQNDKIGDVNDVIIDSSGKVDGVVVSVGGFLGMGEHYVAVSPASVSIAYDSKNNKWRATMNTTKEALKAAPEFKYPK